MPIEVLNCQSVTRADSYGIYQIQFGVAFENADSRVATDVQFGVIETDAFGNELAHDVFTKHGRFSKGAIIQPRGGIVGVIPDGYVEHAFSSPPGFVYFGVLNVRYDDGSVATLRQGANHTLAVGWRNATGQEVSSQ